MQVIVTTNATALAALPGDIVARHMACYTRCRKAVTEGYRHIVGVKLRLPGLAVSKGGTAGPSGPDVPYQQPVLHRDEGDLAQALQLDFSAAPPEMVAAGRWTMRVGMSSGVIYGLYHEAGGPKMPQRSFLKPVAEHIAGEVKVIVAEVYSAGPLAP